LGFDPTGHRVRYQLEIRLRLVEKVHQTLTKSLWSIIQVSEVRMEENMMLDQNSIESAVATAKARNTKLMKQLLGHGVDPKQTRSIDHEFAKAFDCDYGDCEPQSDGSISWWLEASSDLSPDSVCSDEFITEMVTLAAQFGCSYDGWGTEIREAAKGEINSGLGGLSENLAIRKQAAFDKLKANPAFDKEFLDQLKDL
jgi:regulator of RNase E activity RraB